jgi:hypothetical protein
MAYTHSSLAYTSRLAAAGAGARPKRVNTEHEREREREQGRWLHGPWPMTEQRCQALQAVNAGSSGIDSC